MANNPLKCDSHHNHYSAYGAIFSLYIIILHSFSDKLNVPFVGANPIKRCVHFDSSIRKNYFLRVGCPACFVLDVSFNYLEAGR